ncbi:hypothetical protein HDU79_006093 [Rhizoclosmatium sp. JEL0117]|nr:hypothetical protein HDU79_006093 [Rhizoclosmatium sp. JEL0117]
MRTAVAADFELTEEETLAVQRMADEYDFPALAIPSNWSSAPPIPDLSGKSCTVRTRVLGSEGSSSASVFHPQFTLSDGSSSDSSLHPPAPPTPAPIPPAWLNLEPLQLHQSSLARSGSGLTRVKSLGHLEAGGIERRFSFKESLTSELNALSNKSSVPAQPASEGAVGSNVESETKAMPTPNTEKEDFGNPLIDEIISSTTPTQATNTKSPFALQKPLGSPSSIFASSALTNGGQLNAVDNSSSGLFSSSAMSVSGSASISSRYQMNQNLKPSALKKRFSLQRLFAGTVGGAGNASK